MPLSGYPQLLAAVPVISIRELDLSDDCNPAGAVAYWNVSTGPCRARPAIGSDYKHANSPCAHWPRRVTVRKLGPSNLLFSCLRGRCGAATVLTSAAKLPSGIGHRGPRAYGLPLPPSASASPLSAANQNPFSCCHGFWGLGMGREIGQIQLRPECLGLS
jgi:hypothetical protein